LRGRTDTTSACSSWSKQTRSTTACSTPSSLAHSLADRTPFPFFRIQPSESRNRRRATACSHIRPSRHPRIGEKSLIFRLLSDRRDDLVAERTRTLSRLHVLLADLHPGGAARELSATQAAALLR
jgi:hypothetical protein